MNIDRYFVSGYKNLHECVIKPNGLHAITGCNAVGKSNMLESLSFLSSLITGSESQRQVLLGGRNIYRDIWIPFERDEHIHPEFIIEGEIRVEAHIWQFTYHIRLSKPVHKEGPYSSLASEITIHSESLRVKLKGKPGQKKKILTRNANGETTLGTELTGRSGKRFEVLQNMTALAAIKVREATRFEENYPVTSRILEGVADLETIALSPKLLVEYSQTFPIPKGKLNDMALHNTGSIGVIDLFENLYKIKSDDFLWSKLLYWSERLLRITDIDVEKRIGEIKGEPDTTTYVLLFRQDANLLFARELSSGSMILVSLLSILLSPDVEGKVILLEEPEAYLHPRAVADFIALLKNVAEKNTIVVSTHNPVVLNSMSVGDVTLMAFNDDKSARTIPVHEISEATNALERGLISFGDLLQRDFELDYVE